MVMRTHAPPGDAESPPDAPAGRPHWRCISKEPCELQWRGFLGNSHKSDVGVGGKHGSVRIDGDGCDRGKGWDGPRRRGPASRTGTAVSGEGPAGPSASCTRGSAGSLGGPRSPLMEWPAPPLTVHGPTRLPQEAFGSAASRGVPEPRSFEGKRGPGCTEHGPWATQGLLTSASASWHRNVRCIRYWMGTRDQAGLPRPRA